MRMEIPFIAALVLLSNDLMGRMMVQGVEQALFSTLVEWSMKRIKGWKIPRVR